MFYTYAIQVESATECYFPQDITCMDQDGCTAAFSDETLSKILKTPQMLLLEKIRSEKAVRAAGLADLSYCPHCSFGCVIDNPGEKEARL